MPIFDQFLKKIGLTEPLEKMLLYSGVGVCVAVGTIVIVQLSTHFIVCRQLNELNVKVKELNEKILTTTYSLSLTKDVLGEIKQQLLQRSLKPSPKLVLYEEVICPLDHMSRIKEKQKTDDMECKTISSISSNSSTDSMPLANGSDVSRDKSAASDSSSTHISMEQDWYDVMPMIPKRLTN